MALSPVVEAAEQTVIQSVLPYRRQGRVFGLAQALESAVMPITALLIAPLTEYVVIPHLDSDAGAAAWAVLLDGGEARGIALVFFVSGIVMSLVALAAFATRSYRRISASLAAASSP